MYGWSFIKKFKPYLEENYVVADDRTDLYAYFFEQGVRILKDGGRLGFISSSTFFRTGSGEKLRTFLHDRAAIESVIDFGDLQVFEGVTTYPAILTLLKNSGEGGTLSFVKINDRLPRDLGAVFTDKSQTMPRARLGTGSWQLEDDALARLRTKIVEGRQTLAEVYGQPLYGIKTGLNEAFVIDTQTRDRLVNQNKNSVELLVPLLRGEDVKRWLVEPEGLFLINTPKGKVDIDRYPAIRDWLLPFKGELEKRATVQAWWELQQSQLAYQPKFAEPKVIWPQFIDQPEFCIEKEGFFPINKCYLFPSDDEALVALLNSRTIWFCFVSSSVVKRGGFREATAQHIGPLPWPDLSKRQHAQLARLGQSCRNAASQRIVVKAAVHHRILYDLAPPERQNLTSKLANFWLLDFAAFRAEVKRVFKTEIGVNDRDSWEKYLAEKSAEIINLSFQIEVAEREIDAIVYKLFDLTTDEIRLLEASSAGRG